MISHSNTQVLNVIVPQNSRRLSASLKHGVLLGTSNYQVSAQCTSATMTCLHNRRQHCSAMTINFWQLLLCTQSTAIVQE